MNLVLVPKMRTMTETGSVLGDLKSLTSSKTASLNNVAAFLPASWPWLTRPWLN
jgi:hypothetical protein